jgi:hypothetical protein
VRPFAVYVLSKNSSFQRTAYMHQVHQTRQNCYRNLKDENLLLEEKQWKELKHLTGVPSPEVERHQYLTMFLIVLHRKLLTLLSVGLTSPCLSIHSCRPGLNTCFHCFILWHVDSQLSKNREIFHKMEYFVNHPYYRYFL